MGGLQLAVRDSTADEFGLEGEQHAGVAQHFGARLFAHGHMDGGIGRADVATGHPRVVDGDLAQWPADHGAIIHVAATGCRNLCREPVFKCEQAVSHGIDTSFSQNARALDGNRIGKGLARRGTCDQPRQRNRIAADIQNGPTAQRHVIKPRAGTVGRIKAEMAFDVIGHADLARGDDLQHTGDLGMAAVHESFHEEAPFLLGNFCDRHNFGRVHPRRLFAQHMFARPERRNRQFRMPGMRGRDIDRIDLLVGQKGGMIGIALGQRHGVLVAEGLAPRRIPAGNRGQLATFRLRQTIGEIVGNCTRPDDSPANGHEIPPRLP